jgi:hypothetical protein
LICGLCLETSFVEFVSDKERNVDVRVKEASVVDASNAVGGVYETRESL